MTERRRGVRRAVLFAGVLALVACSSYNTETETHSDPRVLDRICRVHACTVSGKAVQTHGITDDSIGFHLGPGPGQLVIPVTNELEKGEVEVLVTGSGSFVTNPESCKGSQCSRPAPSDYLWMAVVTRDARPASTGGQVVVQTTGEQDELDVADVRATEELARCSMVGGPGFRR